MYDIVSDASGVPRLLPADASSMSAAVPWTDLPSSAVVTIRCFRFFENCRDEALPWEKELRNVNSGSLLWLPVHMNPRMHSMAGAKYGTWFTVHHVRICIRHLRSGYHMCEDGRCPHAKTFGATSNIRMLVTGDSLPAGYFWFVSPSPGESAACCDGNLQVEPESGERELGRSGWRHVSRQGPFDGRAFLDEWLRQGSPLSELALQRILRRQMTSRTEMSLSLTEKRQNLAASAEYSN